jgi:hypothetical protein
VYRVYSCMKNSTVCVKFKAADSLYCQSGSELGPREWEGALHMCKFPTFCIQKIKCVKKMRHLQKLHLGSDNLNDQEKGDQIHEV